MVTKAPEKGVTLTAEEFAKLQAAAEKGAKAEMKASRYKTIALAKANICRKHTAEVVAECKRLGVDYNPETE